MHIKGTDLTMTNRPENYFTEKYALTATHSEVLNALKYIQPGKALDLGCGNGRNSLWLASQGFEVTAWDKNPNSLNNLKAIRDAEGLENLHIDAADLNTLQFDGEYDFILSTVVLMFLEAQTIPGPYRQYAALHQSGRLQPDCCRDGYGGLPLHGRLPVCL